MEKEILVIKNFGPIKDIKLELGRVTILIGEQATGKSTVAKLLAICRYFSFIINDYNNIEYINSFHEGLAAWDLEEYLKDDSYIYYDCKHYSLTVESINVPIYGNDEDGNEILEEYPIFTPDIESKSPEFTGLIEQLKAIKPKTTGKFNISSWRPPYTFFKNDVAKVMDNPVYIFESRGLQSTFSLGSKPNISDALHNYFAKVNDILSSYENDTTIEVLHLIYQNKEGNGFFKKSPADNLLRMTSAASGYQSAIPIELIIKHYHDKKKKSKTFIIEEPELNLFPETQMNLVNFLVSEINSTHSSLVLPTHSPYILTSLNNCMLAYEVGNKPGNNDKVGKILEEKYWMNPDDVSAYRLKSDGTTENIVDREEGLIKAEMIDGVSGILNEKFEELLNLEFSKK